MREDKYIPIFLKKAIEDDINALVRMLDKVNNINAGIVRVGNEIIVSPRIIAMLGLTKFSDRLPDFIGFRTTDIFVGDKTCYVFKNTGE